MTISIRVNGGEPILVTDRAAAALRVFNSMAQSLLPESAEFTSVYLFLSALIREIELAEYGPAKVVPLTVVPRV